MKNKLRKKLMNTEVKLTPRELRKLKDGATMEAVKIVNTIPLMVLRDEFGFGKKRLQQYLDALNLQIEAFNQGYLSLKDVVDTINKETGLGYMEEEK